MYNDNIKRSIYTMLEQYVTSTIPTLLEKEKCTSMLLANEFSSQIRSLIYNSTEFYRTPQNLYDLIQFFKAYIDSYAKEIFFNRQESPLLTLMDNTNFSDALTYSSDTWYYPGYSQFSSRYSQFAIPLKKSKIQSSSIIELIGMLCNCNQNTACAIAAALTDIDFEKLFFYTNKRHSADYTANDECKFTWIPSIIDDFNCIDIKTIIGYSQQTIGCICTYRNPKLIINIMATISQNKLVLGNVTPTAYFINHTEIDKNHKATILLFQNYNQARAFEKYLEKCITPPKDIIVTAHTSNDINLLDWDLFLNRNVIFIIETSKYGFNTLSAYQKKLIDQNAFYSIYPYPLIFEELSNGQALPEETERNQLSLLEQNLLKNAEFVDHCEIPDNLTKKIIEKALSPKAFHEWFKQCTQKDKTSNNLQTPASDLTKLSFCRQKTHESVLTDFSQVPATIFFGNGNISLLHARKDSGKSFAALEIAKTLSSNSDCFSLINGTSPLKTLYIDGETNENTLNQRLSQLQCQEGAPIVFSLKALSKNNITPWCSFNLSDENHRKALNELLHKEEIKFLILDNITCLVGDRGIISEKIAQEVMNWVTELSNDVSILIIHHTNEEKDKISGSDIWRRRCTNELQLLGKKDLETVPDLPEELKNIAKSCDGVFFGMRCNSSKSCSILKDKIIWASLPLGASKWNLHAVTDEYGKVLKDLSLEHHEEILPENTTPMSPDPTELPELSDYDKIYNKFGFESFSRPDIDELFDCEKDKSHKIIEKLGAKIEKTGNGNQTRYKLSPQN